MDIEKGKKNIVVSISFKIVLLIGSILTRRVLIKYIGNDANGLSSLYTSIIGMLAVAELGVGEAITFCMFKPIVNGEDTKVAALYRLFKKLYAIIGGFIFFAGIVVMPFLPRLAKDYSEIGVNIYLTYFITLVSVVLTYAYSAKTSLINAYKNNYITTTIVSSATVVEYILKCLVAIITKSFAAYLVCRILAVCIQWILLSIVSKSRYGHILHIRADVDEETRSDVTKNVKALFMHRIGGMLVNTVDSVIISAFIGIVILGKYSNYTTIMTSLTAIMSLCFTPLTSVLGHAFVKESKAEMYKYFNILFGVNYALGVVACLGYYAVIDNVIEFLFGYGLQLDKQIIIVITINNFIQFLRNSIELFRGATGTFYYDRWRPLLEGCVNLALSIMLVKLVGITGVILATIITNLVICDSIEIHVIFKYALQRRAKHFYIINYGYICLFIGCVLLLDRMMLTRASWIKEFLLNGMISLGVAIIPLFVMMVTNPDMRSTVFSYIKKRRKLQ